MIKNRQKAYLALIATALIWGASLPIGKPALRMLSPQQLLFFRYALGSLIMLPIVIIGLKKHPLPLKQLPLIITIELASLSSYYLLFAGLHYSSALESSLILSTRPIFITLAGLILLKETEERHELIGLMLSVMGSSAIVLSPFLNSNQIRISPNQLGPLLIILSNLISALTLILVKKTYKPYHKPTIAGIGIITGMFLFGTITLASTPIHTLFLALQKPQVWPSVLYLGTLAMPIALTLHYIGYDLIEASEAALFRYLQPLVYIPLSVLWLKESIHPAQIIGLLIILIGVTIAEYRPQNHTYHSQHLS